MSVRAAGNILPREVPQQNQPEETPSLWTRIWESVTSIFSCICPCLFGRTSHTRPAQNSERNGNLAEREVTLLKSKIVSQLTHATKAFEQHLAEFPCRAVVLVQIPGQQIRHFHGDLEPATIEEFSENASQGAPSELRQIQKVETILVDVQNSKFNIFNCQYGNEGNGNRHSKNLTQKETALLMAPKLRSLDEGARKAIMRYIIQLPEV